MRPLLTAALVLAGACKSSSPPPPASPAPTETAPAETTPAETPATNDPCYKQCIENGPDDSPMTATDWPKMSADEKDQACSAACADANMP